MHTRPTSTEPYGGVHLRRRATDTTPISTLNAIPEPPYFNDAPHRMRTGHRPPTSISSSTPEAFLHNQPVSLVLLPPLILLTTLSPSSAPRICLAMVILVVYGFDLVNSRDGTVLSIWIGFCVFSGSLITEILDSEELGGLVIVLRILVSVILVFCLASWATLQLQWLHQESSDFAKMLERLLFAILPLASSAMMTYFLLANIAEHYETESAASLAPHIFASFLSFSLMTMAPLRTSFDSNIQITDEQNDHDKKLTQKEQRKAMHPGDGIVLSVLLLFLPPSMYLLSMRHRFRWENIDKDDIYDLILALATPVLLHRALVKSNIIWWLDWKYEHVYQTVSKISKGLKTTTPIITLLAILAIQERYLVIWCRNVCHSFGVASYPPIFTSLFLAMTSISSVASYWLYMKQRQEGSNVFGEYTDDMFQLLVSCAGLFFSLALGVPLKACPIFVLAVLSLALFITTKMLRYMVIFVMVTCLVLSVIVMYRVSFLSVVLKTGISLVKFCMLAIIAVFIIGTALGVVYRAPGGYGSAIRVDIAGILLSVYAILLAFFESTLVREPPLVLSDSKQSLYAPFLPPLTSVVLLMMAVYLKKTGSISSRSSVVIGSIAVAKITIVFDNRDNVFIHVLVIAVLLVTLFAPYCFFEPVSIRVDKKVMRSGATFSSLPRTVRIIITSYIAVLLPLVILVSSTIIIKPILEYLSKSNRSPFFSEIFGWSLSLWGLSATSMLVYYLPNETDGVTIKKAAVISFLLGAFIALAAPTFPKIGPNAVSLLPLIGGEDKGRSGGWGFILACFACLLALTGPLELRERKPSFGQKDQSLLFRLMIFSIMFSCGLSWFITMQSMRVQRFLALFFTMISCMMMSFIGTVGTVLGNFLSLEHFREVQQIGKVWAGSFPFFLFVSSASHVIKDSHAFGLGGWLSTYLIVCCCTLFAFGLGVKFRKEKNSATRALGNLSCILCWMFAVVIVYGHFGLAGIGVKGPTSFAGISASVIGTFMASLILLVLEGESSGKRPRSYRLSSKSEYRPLGINLPSLNNTNRFAPPVASMALIFVSTSFYAVHLRGSGLFNFTKTGLESATVPISHEDVFASVYGTASRTTNMQGGKDVASMARKNLIHSKAVVVAAKLAGSGFWTSKNFLGPFLHLVGIICVIPSLVSLLSYMWNRSNQRVMTVMILLPLNLIPLFLCRGIPGLRAAAMLGLIGGIFQVISMRQNQWRRRMMI